MARKDDDDFSEEWLEAQIAQGSKKPFTRDDTDIDAALAAVMLAHCEANRSIRASHVDFLAEEMRGGRWLHTHQGIAFDVNGNLIDGQHRLKAIIASEKTIKMRVTFGLLPASFKVIDTHAVRKAADVLYIQGEEMPRALAAAGRIVIELGQGFKTATVSAKPSHGQIADLVKRKPHLRVAVSSMISVRKQVRGAGQAGLSAGLYCVLDDLADASKTQHFPRFVEMLTTGIGFTSANHPVARLRNRFVKGDLKQHEAAACTVKAWNAWRTGKSIGLLRWISAEPFPATLQ